METVKFNDGDANILYTNDGADSGSTITFDASDLTASNSLTLDADTNMYFNIVGGAGADSSRPVSIMTLLMVVPVRIPCTVAVVMIPLFQCR